MKLKVFRSLATFLLLFAIVISVSSCSFTIFGITYDNIEEYTTGKYILHHRGRYVKKFFPEYSSIENYNSLYFFCVNQVLPLERTNYHLFIEYSDPESLHKALDSLVEKYDCFISDYPKIIKSHINYDLYIIREPLFNVGHTAFFGVDYNKNVIWYGIYFVSSYGESDYAKGETLFACLTKLSPWDIKDRIGNNVENQQNK